MVSLPIPWREGRGLSMIQNNLHRASLLTLPDMIADFRGYRHWLVCWTIIMSPIQCRCSYLASEIYDFFFNEVGQLSYILHAENL